MPPGDGRARAAPRSTGAGTLDRRGARPAAAITAPASTDGRIARGERTRRRLAESLIELLEEGGGPPTARDVAARAGVSLRLVFHHFTDMEAIYQACISLQVERYWSQLRPAPSTLARTERIALAVRRRARLFEAITPVRRASIALAAQSPSVRERVAQGNQVLRAFLSRTFAEELAAAGPEAKALLDMLDAVTSWELWERLRVAEQLSPSVAQRRMADIVARVLDTVPGPGSDGPARARRRARVPARQPGDGGPDGADWGVA